MTDLLIVGGGIMGLWAGVKAAERGLSVHIVERDRIGSGASGGIVGALMPHMPDRWNPKKQFQYDALVALEAEIARLEAQTGLSAGYRRCGRIMPLAKPHLRDIALRHEQEALTNWHQGGRAFHWHVKDESPVSGWPANEVMGAGIVCDTLAARVAPRALLGLLAAWLGRQERVVVEEGCAVTRLDPVAGRVELSNGRSLAFDRCILAEGVSIFGRLDGFHAPPSRPVGVAVKGQAALLDAGIDPALPVIFNDGLYIIPHGDGRVAIGSTSEDDFEHPFTTDDQLDALIERARRFAPCLETADVIERWAGLRPKAIGRDPIAGRHPDFDRLFVLGGGFKISFGIAHALADAIVDGLLGQDVALPASFGVEHHLALQRRP